MIHTREDAFREIYIPRWEHTWGRWAKAIEDDVANLAKCDYSGKVKIYTSEEADRIINDLMDFFREELAAHPEHWAQKGVDRPPAFDTLKGEARFALCQDFWRSLRDWPLEDV